MRILLLAPQVPWPPHQGTAIRNFHIVRELARRHEVSVLAFGAPDRPDGPLEAAGIDVTTVPPPPPRPIGVRLVDLAATTTPDLARRLASTAMTEAVASVVSPADRGRFDVIQIEGLEMAPHGLAAYAAAAGPKPRLLYDAHNAEWVLQHRAWQADLRRPRTWHGAAYSVAQTWKLRRYERRLLDSVDATVAVSEADAAALRTLCHGTSIAVVPNGVDTDEYQPQDEGRDVTEPALCVFTGKMDFRPNIDAMTWFCRAVWPAVRAGRSDARLAIVGRDPAPRVAALASRDITVTGAVDDVRPWLARAAVVVVPMRVGGGTRLKVLEAMAMGKAIAATGMAVEGLDVRDGHEALLADTPAALSEAVLRLVADADLRERLGRGARSRVEAEYRWSALVPQIERLYAPSDGGR